MRLGEVKEPKRDEKYDKTSEILPQICDMCYEMVNPSQTYMFSPAKLKRIYYHAKCWKLKEKEENKNGD